MEQETLQKKYDLLIEKSRKMRGAQIEYFKYRASEALQAAKKYERGVDEILRHEIQVIKSKQKELF